MVDRISTDESFLDYCIDQRISKKSFLIDVDRLIDWKPIEKLLKKHYKKKQSAAGRPAYLPLPLERVVDDLDLPPETVVLADKGYCSLCPRVASALNKPKLGVWSNIEEGKEKQPQSYARYFEDCFSSPTKRLGQRTFWGWALYLHAE